MNTGHLTDNLTGNLTLAAALGLFILPFLAFTICFFIGKKLPRQSDWCSIGAGILAFLLALFLFNQVWEQTVVHAQTPWFQLFNSHRTNQVFTVGIYLDNLSVLLLVLVTFISLLVQVFSVAYLHNDEHYNRYFAFLSLFTASMLGLVLADNLLVIFIFWELVGFCSYLLIGFWFYRPAAAQASKKAFLVNRVGDIGLLIGLFLLYSYFGTFDLLTLQSRMGILINNVTSNSGVMELPIVGVAKQITPSLLTLTGVALFCGCVGKSAQFPLQVWLPDAMEGPTPVSALIHAATMVAAGIYLLAKCYAFFTPDALLIIAVVGALTALMGALVAGTQFDIKKILAYSTISQLGYMVMGMGVGAPNAALFHLTTHAFFKAALFLIAGIIIHAVHHALLHEDAETRTLVDAQDIRNMGGLRPKMPITFYTYLVAGAALVGVPLFSGFLSKDAILIGAWNWAGYGQKTTGAWWWYLVPVTGFIAVALTAYYMTRQLIFVFFGKFRLDFGENHLRASDQREASWFMLIPVVILALLAFGLFYSLNPFTSTSSWLLNGVSLKKLNSNQILVAGAYIQNLLTQESQPTHLLAPVFSVVLIIVGGSIAWLRFRNSLTNNAISYELSALPPARITNLVFHNFYLDKLYRAIIIKPAQWLSIMAAKIDEAVIDYSINTFAKILVVFSKIVAWADRAVVDGLVRGIAIVARLSGNLGRWMQNGKIQSYYLFSILGLLLLVFYILIF